MDAGSTPATAGNPQTQPHDVADAHGSGIQLPHHGHNTSLQQNVTSNPDLALHFSHEHRHEHLHHQNRQGQDLNGEVLYSRGDNIEKSNVPTQNAQDSHHHAPHSEDKPVTRSGVVERDAEKGGISPTSLSQEEEDPRSHRFSRFYARWKIFFHAAFLALMTGWWIAGLVLHRRDKGWVVPFLVWLFIAIRIITFYIPVSLVMRPARAAWKHTAVRGHDLIPAKLRKPLAAAGTLVVMLIGAFVSGESADNTRANRAVSLFGLAVMLAVLYATSRNRSKIPWHTVIGGILTQFVIAVFVLRTQAGYDIFAFISSLARSLLGFARQGTTFLTDKDTASLPWVLISVIPPIIFFVALVQLLYHVGVLQWFIGKFATFFFWTLRVSGAEAVVAAASPFIGQGESAMLIRPFVPHLTMAEIHQIMTSGFATIAGSVLVAYISFGLSPQALISSCVMSIPASLAVSKMRYPETEETLTAGRVVVPDDDDEHRAANSLHAFANGAWLGLKIAGMIIATLLCIIALVALVNGILTWWGRFLNLDGDYDLTLELILGYICYPIAFLLGVSRQGNDLLLVGKLIGVKLIINEFVAFNMLTTDPAFQALSPRSTIIATYALCGFANIGSLGIQIGVLSQISPGRSADVSRVAVSALISGAIATLSSASIAGLLVQNESIVAPPGS